MVLTKFYYLHETGKKNNQEDFIWPSPPTIGKDSKIFIVCDGVGGSSKGEIASQLVAEYMGNALQKIDLGDLSIERVNTLLEQARTLLSEYANREPSVTEMATTFTMVAFHGNKSFIAWCGDSRVYHFRGGKILYKTDDHSLVNSLVKAGELSIDDAAVHPQKNLILKAIKSDTPIIEAEGGWSSVVEEGDYLLLCTDGLLEKWTDEALSALLAVPYGTDINLAARIQEKSKENTRDNYSMFLLQVKPGVDETIVSKKKSKMGLLVVLLAIILVAGIIFIYQTNRKKTVPSVAQPAAKKIDSVVQQPPTVITAVADTVADTVKQSAGKVLAPVHVQIINPASADSVLAANKKAITSKKTKQKIPSDSAKTADHDKPTVQSPTNDTTQNNF